ncbi:MAG TPA: glycosyltransferase family 4 protein [Candidatus Dormibacteraeota bacterium]|jgi:glycosyltransferase involved in cell wall biosynthesis|nr:glycosyltransferase family 4 protein [Candidatus Dormibacteraeota bacterium]
MRILLVNKYWRRFGGVERYVMDARRAFEELGHEVVPFAMDEEETEPTPYRRYFVPGVEMRGGSPTGRARAAGRAVAGLATIDRLRRLLDEVRIDAAHVVHAYHQLGTTFLHTLHGRGIPIVLSVHDYKLGCPNYRLFDERRNQVCTICLDRPHAWLWAPATRACWDSSHLAGAVLSAEAVVSRGWGTYRRCVGATVVLNQLQRRAAEAAGIAPDRIHTVPNFHLLGDPPSESREGHVLFVGRLVPEKGVDVLIRACAAAGLPLRVVGDGRSRPALEGLAADLGAEVLFAGARSPAEVRSEMERAAALAVPSIWPEVWPFVVLEAWDAGLPVVGADIGGIPEQLGRDRGLLCPSADVSAWANMLRQVTRDDPGLGRRLAAAARAYASAELTEERWVERMRAVYGTVGVRL